MSIPIIESSWVEKYRPSSLNEIASQEEVIETLKNSVITKNIPHLIFFGPSGCGKTSSILALSKDIFKDRYKDRVIELNASDERGISVIRDKIKKYAKYSVNKKDNDDIPPWKIIILDEADSMTSESQFALRRIIEEYSSVTRFCIICNYHNKIIDPIVSRCSLFRFKPIDKKFIVKKLKYICSMENMKVNNKLLNKIIDICRGDLRKAINLLQRCHNNFGNKINCEILDELSGYIEEKELKNWINNCIKGNNNKIDELTLNYVNSGFSLVNQLLQIKNIILNLKLKDEIKTEILIKLVQIDQNLIKGCDEFIQFMRLGYFINSICNSK